MGDEVRLRGPQVPVQPTVSQPVSPQPQGQPTQPAVPGRVVTQPGAQDGVGGVPTSLQPQVETNTPNLESPQANGGVPVGGAQTAAPSPPPTFRAASEQDSRDISFLLSLRGHARLSPTDSRHIMQILRRVAALPGGVVAFEVLYENRARLDNTHPLVTLREWVGRLPSREVRAARALLPAVPQQVSLQPDGFRAAHPSVDFAMRRLRGCGINEAELTAFLQSGGQLDPQTMPHIARAFNELSGTGSGRALNAVLALTRLQRLSAQLILADNERRLQGLQDIINHPASPQALQEAQTEMATLQAARAALTRMVHVAGRALGALPESAADTRVANALHSGRQAATQERTLQATLSGLPDATRIAAMPEPQRTRMSQQRARIESQLRVATQRRVRLEARSQQGAQRAETALTNWRTHHPTGRIPDRLSHRASQWHVAWSGARVVALEHAPLPLNDAAAHQAQLTALGANTTNPATRPRPVTSDPGDGVAPVVRPLDAAVTTLSLEQSMARARTLDHEALAPGRNPRTMDPQARRRLQSYQSVVSARNRQIRVVAGSELTRRGIFPPPPVAPAVANPTVPNPTVPPPNVAEGQPALNAYVNARDDLLDANDLQINCIVAAEPAGSARTEELEGLRRENRDLETEGGRFLLMGQTAIDARQARTERRAAMQARNTADGHRIADLNARIIAQQDYERRLAAWRPAFQEEVMDRDFDTRGPGGGLMDRRPVTQPPTNPNPEDRGQLAAMIRERDSRVANVTERTTFLQSTSDQPTPAETGQVAVAETFLASSRRRGGALPPGQTDTLSNHAARHVERATTLAAGQARDYLAGPVPQGAAGQSYLRGRTAYFQEETQFHAGMSELDQQIARNRERERHAAEGFDVNRDVGNQTTTPEGRRFEQLRRNRLLPEEITQHDQHLRNGLEQQAANRAGSARAELVVASELHARESLAAVSEGGRPSRAVLLEGQVQTVSTAANAIAPFEPQRAQRMTVRAWVMTGATVPRPAVGETALQPDVSVPASDIVPSRITLDGSDVRIRLRGEIAASARATLPTMIPPRRPSGATTEDLRAPGVMLTTLSMMARPTSNGFQGLPQDHPQRLATERYVGAWTARLRPETALRARVQQLDAGNQRLGTQFTELVTAGATAAHQGTMLDSVTFGAAGAVNEYRATGQIGDHHAAADMYVVQMAHQDEALAAAFETAGTNERRMDVLVAMSAYANAIPPGESADRTIESVGTILQSVRPSEGRLLGTHPDTFAANVLGQTMGSSHRSWRSSRHAQDATIRGWDPATVTFIEQSPTAIDPNAPPESGSQADPTGYSAIANDYPLEANPRIQNALRRASSIVSYWQNREFIDTSGQAARGTGIGWAIVRVINRPAIVNMIIDTIVIEVLTLGVGTAYVAAVNTARAAALAVRITEAGTTFVRMGRFWRAVRAVDRGANVINTTRAVRAVRTLWSAPGRAFETAIVGAPRLVRFGARGIYGGGHMAAVTYFQQRAQLWAESHTAPNFPFRYLINYVAQAGFNLASAHVAQLSEGVLSRIAFNSGVAFAQGIAPFAYQEAAAAWYRLRPPHWNANPEIRARQEAEHQRHVQEHSEMFAHIIGIVIPSVHGAHMSEYRMPRQQAAAAARQALPQQPHEGWFAYRQRTRPLELALRPLAIAEHNARTPAALDAVARQVESGNHYEHVPEPMRATMRQQRVESIQRRAAVQRVNDQLRALSPTDRARVRADDVQRALRTGTLEIGATQPETVPEGRWRPSPEQVRTAAREIVFDQAMGDVAPFEVPDGLPLEAQQRRVNEYLASVERAAERAGYPVADAREAALAAIQGRIEQAITHAAEQTRHATGSARVSAEHLERATRDSLQPLQHQLHETHELAEVRRNAHAAVTATGEPLAPARQQAFEAAHDAYSDANGGPTDSRYWQGLRAHFEENLRAQEATGDSHARADAMVVDVVRQALTRHTGTMNPPREMVIAHLEQSGYNRAAAEAAVAHWEAARGPERTTPTPSRDAAPPPQASRPLSVSDGRLQAARHFEDVSHDTLQAWAEGVVGDLGLTGEAATAAIAQLFSAARALHELPGDQRQRAIDMLHQATPEFRGTMLTWLARRYEMAVAARTHGTPLTTVEPLARAAEEAQPVAQLQGSSEPTLPPAAPRPPQPGDPAPPREPQSAANWSPFAAIERRFWQWRLGTPPDPARVAAMPERLRNNDAFMGSLARHDVNVLAHITAEQRARPDFWLTLLREGTNVYALSHAPESLRNDPDFMRRAVELNGEALFFAGPAPRANPDVVRQAVRVNGIALAWAHPSLHGNPDLVLEAVRNDGRALQYADALLHDNEAIVRAATAQSGEALAWVSPRFANDPAFVLHVIQTATMPARGVAPIHADHPQIVRATTERYGLALSNASPRLRNNPELLRLAMQHSRNRGADFMRTFQAELEVHPALLAEAVALHPEALDITGEPFARWRERPELLQAAILERRESAALLTDAMLADDAFMHRLATADPLILDRLPARVRNELVRAHPELLRQQRDLVASAHALGIHHLDRFLGVRFLREVIRNRTEPDVADPRPLAVVVFPAGDHNGAFADPYKVGALAELSRNYRVVYIEAHSEATVASAIATHTARRPASVLILGAHGSQGGMEWGSLRRSMLPSNYTTSGSPTALRGAGLEHALTPNATVVIDSCSTGHGRDQEVNVANMIAAIVPTAQVWAATESTNGQLTFDRHGDVSGFSFTAGADNTYVVPATHAREAHADSPPGPADSGRWLQAGEVTIDGVVYRTRASRDGAHVELLQPDGAVATRADPAAIRALEAQGRARTGNHQSRLGVQQLSTGPEPAQATAGLPRAPGEPIAISLPVPTAPAALVPTGNPQATGAVAVTALATPQARAPYQADVRDGAIMVGGRPLPDGPSLFVYADGRLYVIPADRAGNLGHASFANATGAGEIVVRNGCIVEVTNRSPNIVTSPAHLAQITHAMREAGVDLSHAHPETVHRTGEPTVAVVVPEPEIVSTPVSIPPPGPGVPVPEFLQRITGTTVVARGVHGTHPVLPAALRGQAAPSNVNAAITPAAHIAAGSGNSQFVSWAFDLQYAMDWAESGGGGALMLTRVSNADVMPQERWDAPLPPGQGGRWVGGNAREGEWLREGGNQGNIVVTPDQFDNLRGWLRQLGYIR